MRTIRTNNKMITVRIRINHSKVKLKKKTNNELLFINWHLFHSFDYIQTYFILINILKYQNKKLNMYPKQLQTIE
jgi:hypothetical protein